MNKHSKIRITFALLGRARSAGQSLPSRPLKGAGSFWPGAARPAPVARASLPAIGLLAILAPLLVLVMHSARAQLASTPWPMFHHDLLHTGLSPYDTSANNGTLKWKFTTGNHVLVAGGGGRRHHLRRLE